ncbi:MAG: TfoX/Sxy family protein [Alphaproteobacteria bacterium]
MSYDPALAARLEELLSGRTDLRQQKMFGGIGWMLNGNMCVGVYKDWLITRVGETAAAKLFKEKAVKPMDITGKPMRGWAMIAPEGVAEDTSLKRHTELAIAFVKTLPPKM